MILWLALIFLIIAVSFVLALRSMKDYQEIPQQSLRYGLFLIRRTENFNLSLVDNIRKLAEEDGLIVSIERLFKGKQSALTIFGPKKILEKFTLELSLLELEDYAGKIDNKDIIVWEIGVKENNKLNFPLLDGEGQFFLQIVLGKGQVQIRVAALVAALQNLGTGAVKIPRPYSQEAMINFYKSRSLIKDPPVATLSSEAVIILLEIS